MLEMLLSLCFFLFTPNAGADVQTFVQRLEARYRPARTLQATFLQRYTENGHLIRVEAGTVYFRRPGKMRWEYQSPEKNLFLVDGKTAWFYVQADRTVTRVPAKESTDWRTPLALLAGEMRVSRVCDHVRFAEHEVPESTANAMLYCEVRGSQPQSEKSKQAREEAQDAVYFEVVKSSGELVRVLVKNSGGVAIEFRFENWKSDPRVEDSLFRFTVPPGVAIVNGELPALQNGVNP
jgi:outer membrane lipoprotein carrier protein